MAKTERFSGARFAVAVAIGSIGGLCGCETNDPCALRQAACIDVLLIGKHDDGTFGPIAYRGLSVQVFAPNMPAPAQSGMDKCALNMTTQQPHLYGSELGPVGTALVTAPVPEFKLKADYSAVAQSKVSFQLPDSFNQLPDEKPADIIDELTDDKAKVAKLKELRNQDPRAVRIIVTQEGKSLSAWDSRCDEAQFSTAEWTMKRYYRVGHNEYVNAFALLEGADTSTP